MLRAKVDERLCQGCTPCLARQACRIKALLQIDPGEPAVVDLTRCRGCGDCLPACPYGALAIRNPQAATQVSAA